MQYDHPIVGQGNSVTFLFPLMNGFNLGNEKRRKLYNAITGTELEKESFWSRFKKASEKRNSIVHKGGHASKKEAEGALQSAKELITHLKQL